MSKICLVTGATGFIGQHIVAGLVSQGYKVIALGKPETAYHSLLWQDYNIKTAALQLKTPYDWQSADVLLGMGDITDTNYWKQLFADIIQQNLPLTFVLHLAACATIQQALLDEKETWRVNYLGTKNILQHTLTYWQKNKTVFKGFFYASTDKVYGEGKKESYSETDKLTPLAYPYDLSKAKADTTIRHLAKQYNFPAVVYRFCNVYGPADYHQSRIVPGTLYRLIYKKEPPLLRKYVDATGQKQNFCRDMIYVKDLVNAVILLLKNLPSANHLLNGEVFNLGTENCYPMELILQKIGHCIGQNIPPKEEIIKAGEIKIQCMNYKKLNTHFGFKPQYSLAQGLKETVEWYLKHKEELNEKIK